MRQLSRGLALLLVVMFITTLVAQTNNAPVVNLNDIQPDLIVPEVSPDATPPGPGKRVKQVNAGYETWDLYHILFLPTDWEAGKKYAVIVEYPGNGDFSNSLGDRCTGRIEDCKLGYGLSAGRGFIWVSLPFVDRETHRHALKWWGAPDATSAYCRETVARICSEFGGDANAVILTGFSRGSLACGYIGLRDDDTAKLWRAMIMHSHYDGVRQWKYPDSDPASARSRWSRFTGKPQLVIQEKSIDNIKAFLQGSDTSRITLLALPYPNHTDEWILKDLPIREQARDWLKDVLK